MLLLNCFYYLNYKTRRFVMLKEQDYSRHFERLIIAYNDSFIHQERNNFPIFFALRPVEKKQQTTCNVTSSNLH